MFEDNFINYLTNEKRYSEHTVRSYETDLRQFISFELGESIEKFNPLVVSREDIRKWIVFLIEQGQNPRSVKRKITTLKTFYHFLMRDGKLTKSPVDGVALPKTEKVLPYFVDSKAMQVLFDELEFSNDFSGLRDKTILLTFYCTGMRVSELVNLKVSDIDFSYNQLKVLGKRKKERIIPFVDELKYAIKNYLVARNDVASTEDVLFVTDKGEPIYVKMVYRLVNKYLGEVTTLDKKSPHVLRHTFATHMLNNGADLSSIKELLGHATLSATQVYTHTTFERLKQVYNQAHPRA